MKTIVVMPAYNEGKYISSVLEKVERYADTIVVVDDGSSDDTLERAQSRGDKVIALRHDVNLGKGAALKTGCDAAVELNADIIVCMDADNQHSPETIPTFVRTLQEKNVDIIFGARLFNNNMPFMMFVGNRILSVLINVLFSIFIHDTQSGFRAFTREAYKKMHLESSGYEVETEMIVRASEEQLTYAEIDIDTIYHDHYKGTTAFDGIKILFHILKWKFI